jgi:hypothetical protein
MSLSFSLAASINKPIQSCLYLTISSFCPQKNDCWAQNNNAFNNCLSIVALCCFLGIVFDCSPLNNAVYLFSLPIAHLDIAFTLFFFVLPDIALCSIFHHLPFGMVLFSTIVNYLHGIHRTLNVVVIQCY